MSLPTHFKNTGKISWDVTLTTTSPLHVGSGEEDSVTSIRDNVNSILSVEINNQVYPIIPGSSLKGVLRHSVERMLRSSNKFYACDPLSRNKCGNKYGDMAKLPVDEILEKLKIRKKSKEKGLCLACILFGSQVMKSLINISDFIPETPPPISVKTSTAISRTNGDVVRGGLFMDEFVPPGYDFDGKITIRTTEPDLLGYFSASLKELTMNILSVGAYSSKGFGDVDVSITEEVIQKPSVKPDQESKTIENTETYLDSWIEKIGESSW